MPLVDVPDQNRLQEKQEEQAAYMRLFDPPVDGLTPLTGEGQPRSSAIHLIDVAAKIGQGFTREPLVAEEKPKRAAKQPS